MRGRCRRRSPPAIKPAPLALTCSPRRSLHLAAPPSGCLLATAVPPYLSVHSTLFPLWCPSRLGWTVRGVFSLLPFRDWLLLALQISLNLTAERPALTIQCQEPIMFYFARWPVPAACLIVCLPLTRISPPGKPRP